MSETILVSACLIGLSCRYDGQSKEDSRVLDFLASRDLVPIPVCPEQLGGLATPRPRTWFTLGDGRKVLDGCGELIGESGQRMNEPFIRGAEETLRIARLADCRTALLKDRSPSCGVNRIHLGEPIVPGSGVTTTLLREKGLKVFSEEDLERLIDELKEQPSTY